MALRRQVHTERTTALVALLQPAPEVGGRGLLSQWPGIVAPAQLLVVHAGTIRCARPALPRPTCRHWICLMMSWCCRTARLVSGGCQERPTPPEAGSLHGSGLRALWELAERPVAPTGLQTYLKGELLQLPPQIIFHGPRELVLPFFQARCSRNDC